MRRRALLMGGSKKETAVLPVLNVSRVYNNAINFSTRSGDVIIDWGDGSVENFVPRKNRDATSDFGAGTIPDHNYSPNYTGNINFTFKKGLDDVYSILMTRSENTDNWNRFNITDFKTWIGQFRNLYSIYISLYYYQLASRQATISGDLSQVPDSVKRMRLKTFDLANPRCYLNISNFSPTSQLEWILIEPIIGTSGHLSKGGDLKLLPPNVNFFKDGSANNAQSNWSYTAGRVWRSDFDTLYINRTMTQTEIDNMLIDLANSVTSAVGDKVIWFRGTRSSASDSAVSYLEGLGFTVTITP